jgi:fucose 4-O-acetylase-like acetyltransferase
MRKKQMLIAKIMAAAVFVLLKSEMLMKKRLASIDALKGFAIILVVLGHAIQYSGQDFDNNVIFRIIYAFHMPLFMFLSGVVATYSYEAGIFPYLKGKFNLLVVPFLAWYFLGYIISGAYHSISVFEYLKNVVISPDYGLWFLWVLFLNYCFFVVAVKIEKRFGLLAYPVVYFLIRLLPFGILGIAFVKVHFVYFIAGQLLFRFRNYLKKYVPLFAVAGAVLFPMLVSQWHRVGGYGFASKLDNFFAAAETLHLANIVLQLISLLMAFSGIVLAYILMQYVVAKISFLNKLFCWLGKHTMDVYVSHQLFLFGFGIGIIRIFSAFFVGLAFSLILGIFVLRKVDFLDKLFLGGRKLAI